MDSNHDKVIQNHISDLSLLFPTVRYYAHQISADRASRKDFSVDEETVAEQFGTNKTGKQ
jgi:hypothetical protein